MGQTPEALEKLKPSQNKTIITGIIGAVFFIVSTVSCYCGQVWPPDGSVVVCPISRDTWISSVDGERKGNNGRSTKLKIKGRQEFALLDVDLERLKGRLISGALLHLRSSTPKKAPLARLGISSIAGSWHEGSSNYYRPQDGSACFEQGLLNRQDWAYPGSNILDVIFSRGHSRWRFADCSIPDNQGWQTCAVHPDVVAVRLAGISEGFCIFDDLGSVWGIGKNGFEYTKLPNRFFFSRESWKSGPWMEIWVSGEDSIPPLPVENISTDSRGLKPGEVIVSWTTPQDSGGGKTLGFKVGYKQNGVENRVPNYLVPMAGPTGGTVRMHIQDLDLIPGKALILTIRPVDSAGNVGSASTSEIRTACLPMSIETSGSLPNAFPLDIRLPVVGGLKISIVDLLDKIDPVTGGMIPLRPKGYKGGNHLFCAKQKKIRLYGARNEHVCFQVNLAGKAKKVEMAIEFHDQLLSPKIYEFGYIHVQQGRDTRILPDPLLLLADTFSIPSTAGMVRLEKQANHSLVCEIYIPHEIHSDLKNGTLILKNGQETLKFDIELNVYDFTLPDKLSFVPEMNVYGLSIPFRTYGYYRLAHTHRTCLNRLPYGWNGNPYFAPDWNNGRFRWDRWDRFMEPLFTGAAFDDLPRKGQPVDVFYLPFNENWPAKVHGNYLNSYWADEAFKPKYQKMLSRSFRAFAEHIEKKGWRNTRFQFYLNNKVYYRKNDKFSMAPWIFDEPENIQDFWALRWYGSLWRNSVKPVVGNSKLEYRCDISYGEYKRDILDGIIDVEYIGGKNDQILRMNQEGALKNGPWNFVEYGAVNPVNKGNFKPVLWCRQAWMKSCRGILPWQTIGTEKDWIKNARSAVFYPGKKGPVPSIRLKAFTRGQQDTEYLTMLSEGSNFSRYQIRNNLKKLTMLYDTDYESVSAISLWQSRAWLAEMICRKKSVSESNTKIVNIKRMANNKRRVPDIGYATPSPSHERVKPTCQGDCFK